MINKGFVILGDKVIDILGISEIFTRKMESKNTNKDSIIWEIVGNFKKEGKDNFVILSSGYSSMEEANKAIDKMLIESKEELYPT